MYKALTWRSQSELKSIRAKQGLPPLKEAEWRERLEEHSRLTRADIQLFIDSYAHLLDGEFEAVTTRPFDFHEGTINVANKLTSAAAFYKPYDFRQMIIWVKKDDKHKGILVPTTVLSEGGRKVSAWLDGGADLVLPGQTITRRVAQLECEDIRNCQFPTTIRWETSYKQYSGAGPSPILGP